MDLHLQINVNNPADEQHNLLMAGGNKNKTWKRKTQSQFMWTVITQNYQFLVTVNVVEHLWKK